MAWRSGILPLPSCFMSFCIWPNCLTSWFTAWIVVPEPCAMRRRPELIKGSRRLRIAKGSGTSVQQVNQLVKQFGEMRKLMKGMQQGRMPDLGQLMRNR